MISLLKKLTLVLFSLLFTLAMLEIAVRVLHMGTGGFWEPHSLYGWRNIPKASGWESCYGECAVQVTINSLGLRDVETSYEKPAGTKRVLLLGDSMTAGMQVPLEDTFGKQAQARLNDSSTSEWQILNAAVNGYGTDNELIYYRLEGVKFKPDIVIVGMYLANDIYNNSRTLELGTGGQGHKPFFELTESGELTLQNFPVENTDTFSIRVGTFLKRHFQLPRFVAQTLNLRGEVPTLLKPLVGLFSGNRGVEAGTGTNEEAQTDAGDGKASEAITPGTICDPVYSPEIEEAWEITKGIIDQLRADVEAEGSQLAFLLIPTTAQTLPPKEGEAWYCERPNQILTDFLDEEGIPYLDLLPSFRDHMLSGGETLYYERDFDMNEAGHHLAGEQLAAFILETSVDEQ